MSAVSAPTPPKVTAAPEIRRHLLHMVIGVVAVHALAITLYYALDVPQRPTNFRRVFTGVWMVATLPVVLVGLSRVRAARIRARRARRAGP